MDKNQIITENGLALQPRSCPLCGDAPYKVVGRGYDYDYRTTFFVFEYRRCIECDCVFPNYEPVYGQLHKVYKKSYWLKIGRLINRSSYKRQLKYRNGRLINRIKKLAESKPDFKLLDIGSGRGDLFWILRDFFPNAEFHSVDLTNEVIYPNVKHHKGYFEDHEFNDETFDIITSQHNIEHLYSPRDSLNKTASLLNEGGFVFVMTPNVDALEFNVFKEKLYCAGYSIPRHLTLFNAKSFRRMVDGISKIEIESLEYFFTIHHWMGMLHHIVYDKTRLEKADKWLDFNNILFSVPFYLFDFVRFRLGYQTGVLEITLRKKP